MLSSNSQNTSPVDVTSSPILDDKIVITQKETVLASSEQDLKESEPKVVQPETVKPDSLTGFTLSHTGKPIATEDKKIDTSEASEGIDLFKSLFSEMGALVIRYHLGQGQRAGLLQQISREKQKDSLLDTPAKGRNESDLFSVDSKSSHTRRVTRELEQYSHYSLGRGKVLNERAQGLVKVNSEEIRGEQALWDIMHSPIWGTGINLASQLNKQGFLYVSYPSDMDATEHARVSKELKENNFKVISKDASTVIKTSSGRELVISPINNAKIDVISNDFRVSTESSKASPIGWIYHEGTGKVISDDNTRNLIRVIRVAKGGFHGLSAEQKEAFNSNTTPNDELGTSQNPAFNNMLKVFEPLAKDYQFDPSPLITGSTLKTSYDRTQNLMKKTEIVEDFLTGALITEMVQPLRITQPNSTRSKLPKRYTNPFNATQNNAKAIAFTYDMKTKEGKAILQMRSGEPSHSVDPALLDYRVNGNLINPSLTNPKHIASILSAGLLVAEQVMLEQLLRDACQYGDEHPNAKALKEILKNNGLGNGDTIYKELVEIANKLPKNEAGPILGLQFGYCDPVIEKLRAALGFSQQQSMTQFFKDKIGYSHYDLATLVKSLYQADEKTAKKILSSIQKDKNVENELRNLYNIGNSLQELKGISVREHQSRGINAGLLPVIEKLSPSLYKELTEKAKATKELESKNSSFSDKESGRAEQAEIESSAMLSAHTVPTEKESTRSTRKAKKDPRWCELFTKAAIGTGVAVCATAVAVTTYFSTKSNS